EASQFAAVTLRNAKVLKVEIVVVAHIVVVEENHMELTPQMRGGVRVVIPDGDVFELLASRSGPLSMDMEKYLPPAGDHVEAVHPGVVVTAVGDQVNMAVGRKDSTLDPPGAKRRTVLRKRGEIAHGNERRDRALQDMLVHHQRDRRGRLVHLMEGGFVQAGV